MNDDFTVGERLSIWFGVIFLVVVVIILALIGSGSKAHAHDAPTGWTYPWSCCSSMDCQQVANPRVHETPNGYVVDGATDAAPIAYADKRVKDSPDGDYHWCAHQAGVDAGKTICLFRPPKGF